MNLRLILASALLSSLPALAQDHVEVWREPMVLPSYQVGPADRNPLFYDGRHYQGAKGPIYPYTLLDSLSDTRVEKSWEAIHIENKYVRLSVLPEIGGRIFSGVDKTNGYDFFYRQHVIKPALIGMLGAWISGGVEWNIPHHHRATSFMPVDCTVTENLDGSKTIWVGEIELRHRMKWWIGLTLYPGRSYIEATVRLFNRTPLVHSALYWANPAVHANENYQVIFPPDVEFATFHAKNQFARWPLSHEVYNRTDYSRGVRIDWWKNHPNPTSFFVFHSDMDFLAGYDHGRSAGLVEVSDHNTAPGKKFWEWGNGPQGRLWDKILTDADGPYIELMAGGFSDNQPDYSWIQPYELKTVKQYWYPVRDLGGVKNAGVDGAVNLEVEAGNVSLGFLTTAEHRGASAVLRAGGRELWRQTLDISPAKPFKTTVKLQGGESAVGIEAVLFDPAGQELIRYAPVVKLVSPMPQSYQPPGDPSSIGSVEELYLAGLRLEQFYNADREPDPYYLEALRRDPGNSRVLTALGIRQIRRAEYGAAETTLRKALERVTGNYTRPRSCEAWYYLGVALKAQDKAAEDAFQRAAWDLGFAGAAYAAIAELSAQSGRFSRALEYADRSLAVNAANRRILALHGAILRKLNRLAEARKDAVGALAVDPLDFFSRNELYLIEVAEGLRDEAGASLALLRNLMRDSDAAYLELASDYGTAGLWQEAAEVLSRRIQAPGSPYDAMLGYMLAFYRERAQSTPDARAASSQAAVRTPGGACFPFQSEAIPALRRAMEVNPDDSQAPYCLGNLLYDLQPGEAIRLWEKSRQIDPGFATVHRNLAFGYSRHSQDPVRAIPSLEKALELDGSDPRYLLELDELYEETGVTPDKRLSVLESHQETVLKRDYAMEREVALLVRMRRYGEAIKMLETHHFHVWEGGAGIHGAWVDAHVFRGEEYLTAGRVKEALADFQAALEYPDNLEVARPEGPGPSRVLYWIGRALEAAGDNPGAERSFAAAAGSRSRGEDAYYRGLSLRRLKREKEAESAFADISLGQSRLRNSVAAASKSRQAASRYLAGLTLLAKGDRSGAMIEFRGALETQPAHAAAAEQLRRLGTR